MNIDIIFMRSFITVALLILFIWLVIWAYSKKRITTFNDAANLPFADEDISEKSSENVRTGDHS
jgi:cytochrome c oxidase cbb3-type subunit 4